MIFSVLQNKWADISILTENTSMLNHTVDKLYYPLMTLGGSEEAIVFVNGTENLGYRG